MTNIISQNLGLNLIIYKSIHSHLWLQANKRLQVELAKLRQQHFAKQSDFTTPPPKRTRNSEASRTKSKKKEVAQSDESEQSEDMGDASDALEPVPGRARPCRAQADKDTPPDSSEAKEARLRRICEMKPSGKCHVTPEIHEQWSRGGASRAKLMKQLEACGFDKAGPKTALLAMLVCHHIYISGSVRTDRAKHFYVELC